VVDVVTKKVPHPSSAHPGINEDRERRNAILRHVSPRLFAGVLKKNPFSAPGGPAFLEGVEKFTHDGALHDHPRVAPAPASSPEVKTAILIGNIEPAGKGPLGIDHDELSVISMDIIEGGCPPEGMGGSDLNPRLPHLFPKTPWSSKRSKVVIQDIDLHSFVAFPLKQFG